MNRFLKDLFDEADSLFGIIKHTNVCGIAVKDSLPKAWEAALAGDKESAFGGILFTNKKVDAVTATAIQELFFEVLTVFGTYSNQVYFPLIPVTFLSIS